MERILSRKRAVSRYIFFVLFALSGFSGLIYESIWSHYLKLFLGHSSYSQILVLIIFMGGMALGAAYVSKKSSGLKNPILIYAWVEGIIGIIALLFHYIFVFVTDLAYSDILPGLPPGFTLHLIKYLIAAVLILPQSFLLGTTFPLMTGGLLRIYPGIKGKTISVLYFTNSLGAAIGVLTASFFLISQFGYNGTVSTAGVINIFISIIIIAIAGGNKYFFAGPDSGNESQAGPKSGIIPILLLTAAFTGMASFLYEIGWIRMLNLVLGSTSHAFELMLSAFILGLAIGGFIIRARIEKIKKPINALAIIQLVMGVLAALTIIFYSGTFGFMQFSDLNIPKTDDGFLLFNLYSYIVSLLIMLPATICAGMTLPLITFILLKNNYGEKSIGRVYGINTLGSILGVLAGFLVIMPGLGVKYVVLAGCFTDIALGILFYNRAKIAKGKLIAIVAISMAGIAYLTFGFHINTLEMATCMFSGKEAGVKKEVIFHEDGKTSTVDVIKFSGPSGRGIGISTNGNPLGNLSLDEDKIYHENSAILLAAVPMSINVRAEKAATFGMGTGLTSHVLLAKEDLKKLDIVEIEKEIIEGAKQFGDRVINTLNDPRCHVNIEDAKTFFANTMEKYDLIIADPTSPWVSGISGLYSKEFYELMSTKLRRNGIFTQWIVSSGLNNEIVVSILKAAALSFKHYEIYNVNDSFLMLLASNEEIGLPESGIFEYPEINRQLNRLGIFNKYDLILHRFCGEKVLKPLADSYADIPANSDYFPYLDNEAQKSVFLNSSANELLTLKTFAGSVIEVLEGKQLPFEGFSNYPGDFTQFTSLPKNADYIYKRFFVPGELPENTGNPLNLIINEVKKCMRDSVFTKEQNQQWLENYKQLMVMTLPYLSPEKAGDISREIMNSPCYKSLRGLSPETKEWVKLFNAIGIRDYDKTAAFSSIIFDNESAKETREFLMTINLLGRIGSASEEHIISKIKDIKPESIALRTVLQYMKNTTAY